MLKYIATATQTFNAFQASVHYIIEHHWTSIIFMEICLFKVYIQDTRTNSMDTVLLI